MWVLVIAGGVVVIGKYDSCFRCCHDLIIVNSGGCCVIFHILCTIYESISHSHYGMAGISYEYVYS